MPSWAAALWTVQAAGFFILLFTAAVTDATERRVDNRAVAAGIIGGLLLGGVRGWLAGYGVAGLAISLSGAATAFALFFLFYWLGGLGAGDVKLMTAVGALTSWRFVLWATLGTTIAGAILAIGLLLTRGGAREALSGFLRTSRRERRETVQSADRRRTIPYAVAICAGCLWAVYAYFVRQGAYPW